MLKGRKTQASKQMLSSLCRLNPRLLDQLPPTELAALATLTSQPLAKAQLLHHELMIASEYQDKYLVGRCVHWCGIIYIGRRMGCENNASGDG